MAPVCTRRLRHHRGWRLVALAGTAVALNYCGGWLVAMLDLPLPSLHGGAHSAAVAALAIAYVAAMAVPFVPGIEIGVALMLLLGHEGIALVYVCTQLALAISFVCGRRIPAQTMAELFGKLGLARAQRLFEAVQQTPQAQRLQGLTGGASTGWRAALRRHPQLLLAIAVNLPGNALLGGAGGIGLLAGMSGAYSLARFALLIAIATTPVPLLLLLADAV